MEISRLLFIVFSVFAVLGGLDHVFGNRLGIGSEFKRGILTIGPLTLTMTGMIVVAPLLGDILSPVVIPFYRWLGADPAMFAGSLLACDMGGAPLADQLTQDHHAAAFGGILCASMLGATISFTIPVAMGTIQERDRSLVSKGILCGIVTIPIGLLTGGALSRMPFFSILRNLLPIIPLTILIAVGLWKFEAVLIKLFTLFGKLMTTISIVGLLLALVQSLTDWQLISKLTPIEDAFLIVGEIALLLAGAFPMMKLSTVLLHRPLIYLEKRMGVNAVSMSGLLTTLVNSIATFERLDEMDDRGKVLNMAFAVSASFVFGDHLAFTGGWSPEWILPLIVGKLAAGFTAFVFAMFLTRNPSRKRI